MSANLVIEASNRRLETPTSNREKHERLIDLRASLLPAEAAARSDVEARIAELARRERAEEKGRRLGLSILSPEIFAWKKDNLPAFAVFSVDGEGECVISTDPAKEKIPASCRCYYQGALPQPVSNRIQKFFNEHFKSIWCVSAFLVEAGYFYGAQASASATLGRLVLGLLLGVLASFCASLMCLIVVIAGWTLFVREAEKTAWARFGGVIPLPVKQKILEYQPEFKEILIVAEATWSLTATRKAVQMPVSCDPLIVGWDGDYFWIIDRFDTSSIEQLASDEFAVKADNLD